MSFRSLAEFTRWFLAQPFGSLALPDVPVSVMTLGSAERPGASVTALVLHRDSPYQVEMFIVHPHEGETIIPTHRHPNVDSMEFFLTGGVEFTKNAHRVTAPDVFEDATWSGKLLSVRFKDWHGASAGPKGGSFVSIQRWKNGVEPTSVSIDWIGPAHASHI